MADENITPPVAPVAPAAPIPPAPPVTPVAPGEAAPKNPIVSAILSLIIPGLGQILNGQMKKGIVILVGYIALWIVVGILYVVGGIILGTITMGITTCLCCFVYVIPLVVNLYAAYEAYTTATSINSGAVVKDWLS